MPMQNLATNTTAVAEATPAPDISGTYEVSVKWIVEDEPGHHAEYYFASSDHDDTSGMNSEAGSLEEMMEHILEVVPLLLEAKYDLDPIAPDRVSVKPVGAVNPRGTTQYQVTISP